LGKDLSGNSQWRKPGTSKPVQNVPAQRMTFRQDGVVEVVARRVSHAYFLHHPPGTDVSPAP
jgi:hypothetical protein